MLMAYYEGLHYLDLLTSFANVAWTWSYGGGTQDDPVLDCISHFKARCYTLGVRLESPYTWEKEGIDWQRISSSQGPFLFVISGYSKYLPLDRILEQVEEGSNLAVLYSPFLYSAYEKECQPLLERLGVSKSEVESYASQRMVKEYGQGRIIYIHNDDVNDSNIEGGPFGLGPDADKKIAQAKKRMDEVIELISTFAVPCVDCVVRSVPTSWPQDETLIVEIELRNKSLVDVDSITVDVSLPPEFEPLSNKSFWLEKLVAGANRSVSTLAVPRVKGTFVNPVRVFITYDGLTHQVYFPESQISILDNLQNLLRASKPAQVDLARTLPKYEQYLQPVVSSSTLLRLLEVDPDAVVAKARRVGEHIAKVIARKYISNFSDSWNFATVTRKLYEKKIINAKAKGYIDTVRVLGNIASHADETGGISFSHEDALITCHALLLFLEECIGSRLL